MSEKHVNKKCKSKVHQKTFIEQTGHINVRLDIFKEQNQTLYGEILDEYVHTIDAIFFPVSWFWFHQSQWSNHPENK